jgi:hypothetical protein
MALTDVRVWDGTQFVSIKGPKGETGSTGTAASVTVGTTTEGPAAVTNSGTSTAAVLNFSVPKGADGQAATITVGATTTGAAGTQASVTNVGTQSAAVLNFTVPAGPKGDKGADGTGVSIKGTATAWPPSATPTAGDMYILGDPVPVGAPAGSQPGDGVVYDGTGWSNVGSIQGPKGEKGDDGLSATAAVGTTTTLAAGAQATVTNVGTSAAAVFNFGIPQGAKGDKGDNGENFEVYSQDTQPTAKNVGALWLVTTP